MRLGTTYRYCLSPLTVDKQRLPGENDPMTINLAPDTHPPVKLSRDEAILLAIARRAAEDSPDRSRKVGAVIVDALGDIVSVGCNTLPQGVEHSDEFLSRPAKYDWTEHAERNAIFDVAKSLGKSTDGCTMVLPWCCHGSHAPTVLGRLFSRA